jgi:Rhodopirellula transposase DDE domain
MVAQLPGGGARVTANAWARTIGVVVLALLADANRRMVTAPDRVLLTGSRSIRARPWSPPPHSHANRTARRAPPDRWRTPNTRAHPPHSPQIEHRLFSHVSTNWRGRPLVSHQVIVELIAATRTRSGLRVHTELDRGSYPLGVWASRFPTGSWPRCRCAGTTGTENGTPSCCPPLHRHSSQQSCRAGTLTALVLPARTRFRPLGAPSPGRSLSHPAEPEPVPKPLSPNRLGNSGSLGRNELVGKIRGQAEGLSRRISATRAGCSRAAKCPV